MNLIRFALRKPISILVLVMGLIVFGIGAVRTIKVDILPKMNLPLFSSLKNPRPYKNHFLLSLFNRLQAV